MNNDVGIVESVFDFFVKLFAFAAFIFYGYVFLIVLPTFFSLATMENLFPTAKIHSATWVAVKVFWTYIWGATGFLGLVLIDYFVFGYFFIPRILDIFGLSYPSPALWLP